MVDDSGVGGSGVEQAGPEHGSALQLVEGYELLTGGYERTVDDKGRIVLPAGPWREAFAGRAWIGPYKGQSLVLWTARSFAVALQKVADQETARALPDGTIEHFRQANPQVAIDGQGRLTLPPGLRQLRGIDAQGSMVFIEGQGDRLEIRRLDAANRLTAAEYDAVMDLFNHR